MFYIAVVVKLVRENICAENGEIGGTSFFFNFYHNRGSFSNMIVGQTSRWIFVFVQRIIQMAKLLWLPWEPWPNFEKLLFECLLICRKCFTILSKTFIQSSHQSFKKTSRKSFPKLGLGVNWWKLEVLISRRFCPIVL